MLARRLLARRLFARRLFARRLFACRLFARCPLACRLFLGQALCLGTCGRLLVGNALRHLASSLLFGQTLSLIPGCPFAGCLLTRGLVMRRLCLGSALRFGALGCLLVGTALRLLASGLLLGQAFGLIPGRTFSNCLLACRLLACGCLACSLLLRRALALRLFTRRLFTRRLLVCGLFACLSFSSLLLEALPFVFRLLAQRTIELCQFLCLSGGGCACGFLCRGTGFFLGEPLGSGAGRNLSHVGLRRAPRRFTLGFFLGPALGLSLGGDFGRDPRQFCARRLLGGATRGIRLGRLGAHRLGLGEFELERFGRLGFCTLCIGGWA